MMRINEPRTVNVTLSGRALAEVPKACQRISSGVECFGSSRTRKSSDKKTDSASRQSIPCLSLLFVVLASSHWNPVMLAQSIIGERIFQEYTKVKPAAASQSATPKKGPIEVMGPFIEIQRLNRAYLLTVMIGEVPTLPAAS